MQKFKNSSHVGEIFDQFMSFEGDKNWPVADEAFWFFVVDK